MLDKPALLALARRSAPAGSLVLELASESLYDAQIDARIAAIQKTRFRRHLFVVALALGAAVAAFGAVFWAFAKQAAPLAQAEPATALGVGVATVACFVAFFVVGRVGERVLLDPAELLRARLLAPAVVSETVLDRLHLGGPQVHRWRELAASERNSLRHFDYKLMLMLAAVHELEELETDSQAPKAKPAAPRKPSVDDWIDGLA